MSSQRVHVGVLEIGGTHVTAGLVEVSAQPPGVLQVNRRSWDAQASAADLLAVLEEVMRDLAGARSLSWGIAIPGPFDYQAGIGHFEGVGKFDSLNGVNLRAQLSERLRQPPESLTFVNDASAFVLGEWVAGAAQHVDRVIGLTLGTGIGSAFVRGGALIEDGADVPPQGHVYRLTFDGRPIEDTVSRRALLHRYAIAAGTTDDGLDVRDLADLARMGNTLASRLFAEAFSALGKTMAPWVDRFGAQVLVVGGSIAAAWDLVRPPLETGLGESASSGQCRVVRARVDDAAVLGTGWYAAQVPRRP